MIKSTGVIRKIDDLGRIVLPKEFRRKYKLEDGTPLEIGEHESMIVLRRYSEIRPFDESSENIISSFSCVTGLPVVLCDTYSVVAAKGVDGMKNKELSDALFDAIKYKRERVAAMPILKERGPGIAEAELIYSQSGDGIGALVIPECGKEITQSQKDCLKLCAKSIGGMVG